MFWLFQAPMPFYAGDPNRFTTTWQPDPSQGNLYLHGKNMFPINVSEVYLTLFFPLQVGKTNSSSSFQRKQDKLRWTTKATTQHMPPLHTTKRTPHTPSRTSLQPLTPPITLITRRGYSQFPRRGHLLTVVHTPQSQAQGLPITPQNTSSNTRNKPPLLEQPLETTPDLLQLHLIKIP